MPLTEDIIALAEGTADEETAIKTLQQLIDTGQAWHLEGSMGRAAMSAIESGACVLGIVGMKDYWGNYVPSRFEVKPGTKGSPEYAHDLTHGSPHRKAGRFAACPFAAGRKEWQEARRAAR
jgi:hypothetical protein